MQPAKRPTGVTIIAILNIIGGIIMVIVGLLAIALSSIIPLIPPEQQTIEGFDFAAPWFAGAINAIGGVFIAIGIASLVVAYGLWNAKGWAWSLTVILAIIGIALDVVFIVTGDFSSIISIIISGVILYYVYRPHVKAYFGKGVKAAQPS